MKIKFLFVLYTIFLVWFAALFGYFFNAFLNTFSIFYLFNTILLGYSSVTQYKSCMFCWDILAAKEKEERENKIKQVVEIFK